MKPLELDEIKRRMLDVDTTIEIIDKYSKKVGIKKVRNRTFVKCKCRICGNVWESELSNLLNGCGCMICSGKIKKTLSQIKKELKEIDSNIEIISDQYINNETKLKCRCLIDGYEWEADWKHLSQGKGCPECGGTRKLTLLEVKEKLKEINPNIEIISDEYKSIKDKLECKCLICGYTWKVSWSHLKRGHGCHMCSIKARSGENHPRYNPNLTEEERENGRKILGESYDNWRLKVFERDDYTCQCCGDNKGGNLNPHHLDGYNWAKDKRVDVDNGVTLCEDCHLEFHNIYGYGDNTREQFEEFIEDYKKDLEEAI